MSPDTDADTDGDRIAVPTNGHAPTPVAGTLEPLRGEPPTASGDLTGTSDEELSVAFSPKQAAIGFGILASLILVAAGWARRRRPGG